MKIASKICLWAFIILSMWNFLFPPRVEMGYPEHMAKAMGRSFYYVGDFNKVYHSHPDYEDPNVKEFGGGFVIHWENLIVTQAMISFMALGALLLSINLPNNSKRQAEQVGDGDAEEAV